MNSCFITLVICNAFNDLRKWLNSVIINFISITLKWLVLPSLKYCTYVSFYVRFLPWANFYGQVTDLALQGSLWKCWHKLKCCSSGVITINSFETYFPEMHYKNKKCLKAGVLNSLKNSKKSQYAVCHDYRCSIDSTISFLF